MKQFRVFILITLFFLLLSSCSGNYGNFDPLKGFVLNNMESLHPSINKDDIILLYVFDGNCSECVAETIDWIKEWNNYDFKKIECYFISRSKDAFTVEYYFEMFGVKLETHQHLIADTHDVILQYNKFLDPTKNILLLDKNNKIITSRNPFHSKQGKKIYKNYLKH